MKNFLIGTLFALAGFQANAAVIDFNNLTGSGWVNRGSSYVEDGFRLVATGSDNVPATFGSIHPGDASYTGSTSFFNNFGGGTTTLTKVGGGLFSLDSIDLDSLNGRDRVNVTFVGTLLNGGNTSVTFTTNNSYPNLQTFTFGSSFDNVTSVSWAQTFAFHSFDNIVVNTAQVPEPATTALFGLGLLGFAVSRRKSAKSKNA